MLPSRARKGNKYRSNRAVRGLQRDVPTHLITKWTREKAALVIAGTCILATISFLPVFLIERSSIASAGARRLHAPASLQALISKSTEFERKYKRKGDDLIAKSEGAVDISLPGKPIGVAQKLTHPHLDKNKAAPTVAAPVEAVHKEHARTDKSKSNPEELMLGEEQPDTGGGGTSNHQQLARGVSGLPMSQTPALVGAKRGHIECDVDVDEAVYWNDPQGTRDEDFVSPFKSKPGSYLTFEPDPGGWNNIRMSMEIIFVIAAVTGRTLVLPPKAPFYLLGTGSANAKSFGNFFPLDNPHFKKRVNVITMSEYLELEGKQSLGMDDATVEKLRPVAEMCLHQPNSEITCSLLFSHLQEKGLQPPMQGSKDCFIFDEEYLEEGRHPDEERQQAINRFCGTRTPHFLDKELQETKLIHWDASIMKHRLLEHFYTFLYFTDPAIDNFYKRFVRDFLHYKDEIYCAAGKIILALNKEAPEWSSMHIRRGDFQYQMVKLPAEEWYANTKELWNPNEIIFIATDERNKTFFDPIKEHNPVRFLDDYWDMAGLGDLDSNYLGMIDTIVASHGRKFAGTWFSTFSGYINRMRGYLGHSMTTCWYSWLERKDIMQNWTYPNGNYPAREWPIGWVGIDGDTIIEHELTPVVEEVTVVGKPAAKVDNRNFHNTLTLADLKSDEGFSSKPAARGLTGRPVDETPALNSAARAHVTCDINVDSLAYWNDPQGERDQQFVTLFKESGAEKYITFTSDRGGWNNVRMSMEIIFVIAAATGRTLVLPPKEPLYRLRADLEHIHRGFADFFPLHTAEFQRRVKVISTEEFVRREGGADGVAPIPEDMKQNVMNSAKQCNKKKESKTSCTHIADYLAEVAFVPDARAKDFCFVFDEDASNGLDISNENEMKIAEFCGNRHRAFWDPDLQQHPVIHFRAGEKEWRLLAHFYGFTFFTDPSLANYYKRFVRDFLHYNDQIYCAAGKIVKALQAEAAQRGFTTDAEGGGGYSAMHIRRGDFQYKRVKIPAEQWYNNTKEIWKPREIIFIATDERDKSFFDPIAQHHDIRFLDDYFDFAELGNLDPNFFGMIDTIISSRARAFAGTWFSTFTGYINRMRGYHGMTMMDSWYSFLPKKTAAQVWPSMDHFVYAFEWPDGWMGIDADELPDRSVVF